MIAIKHRPLRDFLPPSPTGVDERDLSTVEAEQDEEAPTMTRQEARELMFWQDMGQKSGEKSHRLLFYASKDDAESKRGSMTYGRVSKDAGSSKWFVEDGDSFTSLADAKRQAVDLALDRAEREGYITVRHPSEFDATLRACAKQLARVALADAQAESWRQLQAGITALFNGVKP